MKLNYEKLQHEEQEKTNLWLIVNTIFTILAGAATTAIAWLTFIKR